jgi:hypothetical protein
MPAEEEDGEELGGHGRHVGECDCCLVLVLLEMTEGCVGRLKAEALGRRTIGSGQHYITVWRTIWKGSAADINTPTTVRDADTNLEL